MNSCRKRRQNATLLYAYTTLCNIVTTSSVDDYCSLDTGYTTLTDGHGYPHSVFISATRDGSIWVRAGRDHASLDWVYDDERRMRFQSVLIDQQTVQLFESINYTDFCVLTDLEMRMTVDSGWHPSHISIYEPSTKHNKIIVFKHNRYCYQSTVLTLSGDKQGITCSGGSKNSCRKRTVSEISKTDFIKVVNFDPQGQDHWQCEEGQELNRYSFRGSYYHAFVKIASCDKPKGSRVWGHEAKLRPHRDTSTNVVIIPDSSQTAITNGTIKSWHVFAKVISIEHSVSLQVWRPATQNRFTLIGEKSIRPSELRFQEIALKQFERIKFLKGDVLGLYVSDYNPIAWSSVPCASAQQRYRYVFSNTSPTTGQSLTFHVAPAGEYACRQYSFSAILADSSNAKIIEDWTCPTEERISVGTRTLNDAKQVTSYFLTETDPEPSDSGSEDSTDRTKPRIAASDLPAHLILSTIGCLVIILLIVGVVSYNRALRG